MKKVSIGLIMLVFFLEPGFAQTQVTVFNPFSMTIHGSIATAKDTAGILWYAAIDSVTDTVHIINESHSLHYTAPNPRPGIDIGNFTVDSRNDIWFMDGYGGLTRISNSVAQQITIPGQTHPINPLVDSFDYFIIGMADDHNGNNYILSYAINTWDAFVDFDSVFVTKFDGTNFTTIDLTTMGYTFPSYSSFDAPTGPSIICDYSGKVFLSLDTVKTLEYDGLNWTTHPAILFESGSETFFDRSNNRYINDHSQQIYKVLPNYSLQSIYTHGAGNILCSDLFLDNDGSVWFTEYFNFYKLIGNNFVLQVDLTTDQQLINGPCFFSCLQAEFDSQGNIIGSSYGCGLMAYSFNGFNQIEGSVFLDTDSNGVFNNGERGIPGLLLNQTPDNHITNTDSAGRYAAAFITPIISHSINFTPPQFFHLSTSSAYAVNPGDSLCCYDFGIVPDGAVQDLEISTTCQFAVPGYTVNNWLSYKNKGTITLTDTITYHFDPLYTFISSNPAPAAINGNILKWVYQALQPFEERNIDISLYLDSSVALNTLLFDTAMIGPVASDTTPSDNVVFQSQVVIGAFDPNEKTVSRTNFVDPGEQLTYTIFFQNTGTFYATDVIIRDTLSAGLDLNTFEVIGFSHPMTYRIKENGIIEFKFSNILLPDSNTNEPASHGFVKYTIDVKNNVTIGQNIQNSAFIYFDFNSPVATNTTNSYIGISGITSFGHDLKFSVYPNPNSGKFSINISDQEQADFITITDLTGRNLLSKKIKSGWEEISMENLPKGFYLIQILKGNEIIGSGKIIVN